MLIFKNVEGLTAPSIYTNTNRRKHTRSSIILSAKNDDSDEITVKTGNYGHLKSSVAKSNNKYKGASYWKDIDQAKAINKELMSVNSAHEVLDLFISKGGAKGIAGNNVFNSVNFSTLIHRLARFALEVDHNQRRNQNQTNIKGKKHTAVQNNRSLVLSDPRTAILLASLSEAIVQPRSNIMLQFNNRELANLAWAIAKLKIVPPVDIFPMVKPDETVSIKEMEKDLLITASKVRAQVLDVARERSALSTAEDRASVQNKWIPTLSQLSGKLLDIIAAQVLEILEDFNSQELANLMYAFASAQRADEYLFDKLATQLVERINSEGRSGPRQEPKPQEYSNSVWSFASSGIRSDGQVQLVRTVADKMDEDNGKLVQEFKPQELSNTAWGCATLLVKRGSDISDKDEDDAILRIMRWVAKSLEERVESFKPQEGTLFLTK